MRDYELFKDKVHHKTGINLSLYKEKQMKRRLSSLANRNGYDDFGSYFKAIDTDKELFNEFINYLTINVSEFYRNPDQWKVVESEILPQLLKNKKSLKIWSAACSTGEEPYSMVMLLSKFMPLNKIKIIATDIDQEAINKAKNGVYQEKSLKNLPKNFIDDYFIGKDGIYQVKDEIKQRVEFKKHNLLKDKYFDGCDLIVCRNVLIYFTEEAKAEIYKNFSSSLNDEGYLFVGSTEQIIMPNKYNLKSLKTFFYGKTQ
ncbi:chemotaxis protein methyltransferase CheR [Peptoclostridium litorale DSM 5388]|uniref:protein-glutamate O-methyltransferase n=1 Tax=Peptoclostridium litorale DSM 5388 TaxID=1121324 RepID=A0A069RDM0_PEPLI|nr:protein-glutamate O-methyltransferase CheR [Peptoclostridium litorale]KDR95154.1 chemotaxis protein methyltransferase CheR [Peptoclostridium litorale DSM 5388]SIN74137.1 chemotaxis protein methyltransferase CheR [Peptoclostridium litorale DSM 5388]